MKPYFQNKLCTIYCGDCREVLPELDMKFDNVVCDPPYGLQFMGKDWDHGVPGMEFWQIIKDVSKPGAMLLAFGGTRTSHRLTCAIEDAGWEIRDCVMYLYGSGFPKSLDISKAIDKAAGVNPIDLGKSPNWRESKRDREKNGQMEVRGENAGRITAPTTEAAKQWDGWGTALKPAYEPICLAMNPLEGTYAQNAVKHSVAGLNIDGGRVGTEERTYKGSGAQPHKLNAHEKGDTGIGYMDGSGKHLEFKVKGRWPANIIHDGSPEVLAGFPVTKSGFMSAGQQRNASQGKGGYHGGFPDEATATDTYGDTGSAARFFYCAKASKAERDKGLGSCKNPHPTLKPLALMRYLLTLVKTPTGGVTVDPFMGSGSTLVAAEQMGRQVVGIELEEEYCEIAAKRIQAVELPLGI